MESESTKQVRHYLKVRYKSPDNRHWEEKSECATTRGNQVIDFMQDGMAARAMCEEMTSQGADAMIVALREKYPRILEYMKISPWYGSDCCGDGERVLDLLPFPDDTYVSIWRMGIDGYIEIAVQGSLDAHRYQEWDTLCSYMIRSMGATSARCIDERRVSPLDAIDLDNPGAACKVRGMPGN